MKIKKYLENKLESVLKLSKASGEIGLGINQCKRAIEEDKAKLVIIASDLEKKDPSKSFKIPDKESFDYDEVVLLIKKNTAFIKKHKSTTVVNIKKKVGILKLFAEKKGVPVIEGMTRKKIGTLAGAQSGKASCAYILTKGRSGALIDQLLLEND